MALFSDILLTVDYDRTLTAPDSSIPERNLEAIRYFMENGGAFTVNTGRSIPMAKLFMDKVPVNAPLLLYNGSAAYDTKTKQLTFAHRIGLDMWETVAKIQELFPDLNLELQGVDAHYRFTPENPGWDAYCDNQPCARGYAQPGEDVGPFLKLALYGQFRQFTVASMYDCLPGEMERMDRAEEALREALGSHCEVFRACPRIIDIHARGVSKGRSARELQQVMGRKVLVCVGDAHNDLTMLEDADHAFVPSDSPLADSFPTVCTCTEGAVADVIYEKIPEILRKMS